MSSTIFPSAKNWLNVILKPLQMDSKVEMEGVVFWLKRLEIVDCERPEAFARRYSVQFRSVKSCLIRSFTSKDITTLVTILVAR